MRIIIFALSFIFFQSSFAALPEGQWVNEKVVADDGAYGSYYKAWFSVYGDNVDQIISLGAHFEKTKFIIQKDDGSVVEVVNPATKTAHKIRYTSSGNGLSVCVDDEACLQYQKTQIHPDFTPAPDFHPKTRLFANWCLDTADGQDCELIAYSDFQSESIFSLVQGFNPVKYYQYEAPVRLQKKYGLHLSTMTYSYRLKNDGHQLSSFSSSFFLMADNKSTNAVLAKSGVVVLKTGSITQLSGPFQGRNIQVEFFIHERP